MRVRNQSLGCDTVILSYFCPTPGTKGRLRPLRAGKESSLSAKNECYMLWCAFSGTFVLFVGDSYHFLMKWYLSSQSLAGFSHTHVRAQTSNIFAWWCSSQRRRMYISHVHWPRAMSPFGLFMGQNVRHVCSGIRWNLTLLFTSDCDF